MRSRIIKSTNSQTKVSDLSLMANEPIQESIEDRLRLYSLYYDRKRGEYRRLKKPIKDLVGMGALAQAFMAVVLQQPDQARGRPATYVKNNPKDVYDENIDLDFYAAAILIDRQVEGFLGGLRSAGTLSSNEVRNLRYYVAMLIGKKWNLSSKSKKSVQKAMKELIKPLPSSEMQATTDKVKKVYKLLGANDKAAKSSDMTSKVFAA